MKISEILAERKAAVELIDDLICQWIRWNEMPGYCKETDPYKWYFTDNKEVPSDENLEIYMALDQYIKEYLQDFADDDAYRLLTDDNYYSSVIQMLDEDKYHWSDNTNSAYARYVREQERLERVKKYEETKVQ